MCFCGVGFGTKFFGPRKTLDPNNLSPVDVGSGAVNLGGGGTGCRCDGNLEKPPVLKLPKTNMTGWKITIFDRRYILQCIYTYIYIYCIVYIYTPGTLNHQFLMVGYQLDDEPNHYMKNGWKSPFPSFLKTGCFGVAGVKKGANHNLTYQLASKISSIKSMVVTVVWC